MKLGEVINKMETEENAVEDIMKFFQ